jgi:hypothetical protein
MANVDKNYLSNTLSRKCKIIPRIISFKIFEQSWVFLYNFESTSFW